MNDLTPKQKYTLAYRYRRAANRVTEFISETTYPYWFDCPDRFECGNNCYCLENAIKTDEIASKSKSERERIEALNIEPRFFSAAVTSYESNRHHAPTSSLLCKLANMGYSRYIRAYPVSRRVGWKWTIANWTDQKEEAQLIQEDKVILRQKMTEILSDKEYYMRIMCNVWKPSNAYQ